MKFQFKIQQYQTDAVKAVTDVFNGQLKQDNFKYIQDSNFDLNLIEYGYKNAKIELTNLELLNNINTIQLQEGLKLSNEVNSSLGVVSLDIEMETGTGKTYVYIKTIFELNKLYGFSKFIVVVPSIAIREGVKKSFEITSSHFMEQYGEKAHFFIYNSDNLQEINQFATNNGIQVMIINTQAFNSSFKEEGNNQYARKIFSERDDFNSRRPIDVISATNPILILDEPQKMGKTEDAATQKALKKFNPLFSLNYSATHAIEHNKIYVLDALDAYNKKLVKRIEVKGVEVQNLKGQSGYVYLEDIILSKNEAPKAKVSLEIKEKSGIKRKTLVLTKGDDLKDLTGLNAYKGYNVSDITVDGLHFTNGKVLTKDTIIGNKDEATIRRIQIRETIKSHFEKEEELFKKGIKTLSLFFIDEVSKYRVYNESGEKELGEYGKIFEEEYVSILNEHISIFDSEYQAYLRRDDVSKIHNGYFSIDKKSKRFINSETKRGKDISDDTSAYDLILKDKETLLSFSEPTRFIFSHSALREGWDNPNIFQICTLKESGSETSKRQEVGRGLRLCVNQDGIRQDTNYEVNELTVIASESYSNFVSGLQDEIKKNLYDRPSKATKEYFSEKYVVNSEDKKSRKLTSEEAKKIERYLVKNDYVDDNDNITSTYKNDVIENNLAPLPDELMPYTESIHNLIRALYENREYEIKDGNKAKVRENPLNKNFNKAEFQELWHYINHKYAYTVDFDSDELIKNAIKRINDDLAVKKLTYSITTGEQAENLTREMLEQGDGFKTTSSSRKETLQRYEASTVKYDLIGDIAKEVILSRRTIGRILKGLRIDKLYMFRINPEEFIKNVSRLIKEEMSDVIIEHITYNKTSQEYDSTIFTKEKISRELDKAYTKENTKHIQNYVFYDSDVEKRFAKDLDIAEDVSVFAKLPRSFTIPTPLGDYAPDWAIAFKDSKDIKHIFLIAETKGSLDVELKKIEETKINCAKKLFNSVSTSKVKYYAVTSYNDLLDEIRA
ncbi:MAG: DEAD/DEAH box helicase family protein [Bdellovibrionota bacterium]|nr:DEAD/DEAH box helicase family protein [Pseudomonadota bacterium]MDY6091005.1 DEAD/DEAH box helicase family protein [Bdellovibrionota bacterium]